MAKRTTRAQTTLNDLQKRIERYEQAHQEYKKAADRAWETLSLLRSIYDDLERTLAPKPRGKSTPAPSAVKKSSRNRAQPALTQSTEVETANVTRIDGSVPVCAQCLQVEDFQDHFKPSPNYHKFQGKKKETIILPDNPEDFHKGASA